MNYKLAKKLKDAGFPQDKTKWILYTISVVSAKASNEDYYALRGDDLGLMEVDEILACPTLSELIETCGDELYFRLDSYMGDWRARISGNKNGKDIHIECLEKTKKEVVAKLWLRLNK